MQGLRAFLPLVEFAKFPNKEIGETFEDFVSGCTSNTHWQH